MSSTHDTLVSADDIVRETNLPILKEQRDASLKQAEIDAYLYARTLDTGLERAAAFEVYETIRTVLRRG